MRTGVLSRPIVSIRVRCGILILLIQTVRCSIRHCMYIYSYLCVCVCVCPCVCEFYKNRIKIFKFRRSRKIAKSYYYLHQVCPSVHPHGTTQLPLRGFSRNFIFEYFSKICRENSSFLKILHE
jgi:hypothetical protein